MKRFFLGLLLLSASVSVYAQKYYSPNNTTQGDSASYYCYQDGKDCYEIRNVKNIDTTLTTYYADGSVVDDEDNCVAGVPLYRKEQLYTLFREFLTDEEFVRIKSYPRGAILIIGVTSNAVGNAEELYFRIFTWDDVFLGFSPDRLFALEKKLKELLKISVNHGPKLIKNMKYIDMIDYRDFKKMN